MFKLDFQIFSVHFYYRHYPLCSGCTHTSSYVFCLGSELLTSVVYLEQPSGKHSQVMSCSLSAVLLVLLAMLPAGLSSSSGAEAPLVWFLYADTLYVPLYVGRLSLNPSHRFGEWSLRKFVRIGDLKGIVKNQKVQQSFNGKFFNKSPCFGSVNGSSLLKVVIKLISR